MEELSKSWNTFSIACPIELETEFPDFKWLADSSREYIRSFADKERNWE